MASLSNSRPLALVSLMRRGQAGDIAAGPPNTSHVLASNWVRVAGKNDRDCGCRSPRRLGVDGTRGHDNIDLQSDEFVRNFVEPIEASFDPSVLHDNISTLDPA